MVEKWSFVTEFTTYEGAKWEIATWIEDWDPSLIGEVALVGGDDDGAWLEIEGTRRALMRLRDVMRKERAWRRENGYYDE